MHDLERNCSFNCFSGDRSMVIMFIVCSRGGKLDV